MDFKQIHEAALAWSLNSDYVLKRTDNVERKLIFVSSILDHISFYVQCPNVEEKEKGPAWHVWSEKEEVLQNLGDVQEFLGSCKERSVTEVLNRISRSLQPMFGAGADDDDDDEDDGLGDDELEDQYYVEDDLDALQDEGITMEEGDDDDDATEYFTGDGSSTAVNRLLKDLKALRKSEGRYGVLGTPRGDNLFIWDVKLTDFPTDSLLGQDLAKYARKYQREANKPLMERKRRARINQSLTQLKALVLEGMKKDPTRYSRLEKADILEMTVTHLKSLHRQKVQGIDSDTANQYRAGFAECATEVKRYLGKLSNLDDSIKSNILNHVTANIHKSSRQKRESGPTGGSQAVQGGLFMLVASADGTAAVPVPVNTFQKSGSFQLQACTPTVQNSTPIMQPNLTPMSPVVSCPGRVPLNGSNVTEARTGAAGVPSVCATLPSSGYNVVLVPGQGYAIMVNSSAQVKATDKVNQGSVASITEPLSLVISKESPTNEDEAVKDSAPTLKRESQSAVKHDSQQARDNSEENSAIEGINDSMWRPW